MKTQIKTLLAVLFLAAVFTTLGILIDRKVPNLRQEKLLIAYDLIKTKYSGNLDETQMTMKLVESIGDEYSYYVSRETYQKIKDENQGKYIGVGFVHSYKNGDLKIIEVFPGSPAEKSGFKPGDTILAINQVAIASLKNPSEIAALLKGEEGQQLNITIKTPNQETKDITLKRETLNIPSLTFKEVSKEIGYLKISRFRITTENEFIDVANSLKQKNIKKLVIDLRNNLGGNTEAALFIDKQFISSGILLREKFSSGKEFKTEANEKAPFEDIHVIILTNKETSSAAELMAAAFKDNKRAQIVGEKTFGKASIGNYFEFKDGSAIHLTIGYWLRPNGESIKGIGIEPDISISDERSNESDKILEKAIEKK